MSRFQYDSPERLQFREGGGVLAAFGVPFFLAGLFLLATAGGAVPMGNPGDLGFWARPLLGLMGLAFTGVGGGLVFGRAWTILDRTERAVIKSWGLLVPLRQHPRPLDDFTRVTIGFEPGDSDSSEKFPVTLKARSGPDLVVCNPTGYDDARACAAEAATHLGVALEDASGDHAVTLDPADVNRPLQERAARDAGPARPASPPTGARSHVHQETAGVRIVIPVPRTSPLALLLVAAPIIIPVLAVPRLWRFFQQTHTPEPIGLVFLGLLAFLFGVLPALTMLNGFVRSRVGHTEVHVSRDGVTVRERRAWRTYTLARLAAGDVLDVDYGTRDTGVASTRLAVEQKMRQSGHDTASLGPRMDRVMAAAARWTKGRGVIVKSRQGLTSFGQDLDDDEIRYLHAVVRQALVARV
ncbi:MAG TPA: hypothetical protein VGQ37_07275 [Vicinamibacterales bacterium]|nr:hypothetical protein [Vicinamibacterales bacterium]